MVYFTSWKPFFEAAQKLHTENPTKTRYVVKYRHCDSKLVLKVTDDKTCLKYKASHAQIVKKMDKLNNLFLRSSTEKLK